jgi:hypothetical protein
LTEGGKGINMTRQEEPFLEGRLMSQEEVARMEAKREAAKRAARETPGTRTEHLRLMIDFHITIAGTPPDDDGLNEPDPTYHARQARLLEAVKGNPAVLKQWLYRLVADQMRFKDGADWDVLTGGDPTLQDIFAPALATLPEDDQEYFADMEEHLYFDEMTDLFQASFTITEDAPTIVAREAAQPSSA